MRSVIVCFSKVNTHSSFTIDGAVRVVLSGSIPMGTDRAGRFHLITCRDSLKGPPSSNCSHSSLVERNLLALLSTQRVSKLPVSKSLLLIMKDKKSILVSIPPT